MVEITGIQLQVGALASVKFYGWLKLGVRKILQTLKSLAASVKFYGLPEKFYFSILNGQNLNTGDLRTLVSANVLQDTIFES